MNVEVGRLTRAGDRKNILISTITFLILAGVILAIWGGVYRLEQRAVQNDSVVAAEQAASRLVTFISSRIAVINHIAEEWLAGEIHDQVTFEDEAGRLQNDFPGLDGITRLDAEGVIRWVSPLDKYRRVVGRQVHNRPTPGAIFDKARQTGKVQITWPIELVREGKGIVVHYPLKHENRFDGTIGTVIRISDLIEKVLVEMKDHIFSIADGDILAYSQGSIPVDDVYFTTQKVQILGRVWTITHYPTEVQKALVDKIGVWIVVASGFLLSAALCWFLFLYLSRQTALAENENRFKDFANSAADRFWETDEWHRFVYASDTLGSPKHFFADEVVGKKRWEVEPQQLDADIWREHREVIEAHRPFKDFHYSRTLEDGSVSYHRASRPCHCHTPPNLRIGSVPPA